MRSIFLIILTLYVVFASRLSYFASFLLYIWFDLLKPQNLTWGLLGGVRYSLILYFSGLYFSMFQVQFRNFKIHPIFIFLILYTIHISIAHFISQVPIYLSDWKYSMSINNLLFVITCTLVIRTRAQIEAMLSIFVCALSFYLLSKAWQTLNGGGGIWLFWTCN